MERRGAPMQITPPVALRAVRLIHTVIWAFFAGIILAIPVVAWQRRFGLLLWLAGIVLVEVAVLAVNQLRCPLTAVAARYTTERQDNFDIYLPLLLARYNKQIFGGLFVAGLILGLVRWLG
jgi:hypothetical protein